MSDIQEITKDLGRAYRRWKDGEAEKDKARKAFWTAIEETVEPEEKLIEVAPESLFDDDTIDEYVEREYPAWDLEEWRSRDDDWIEAILTLKPEFLAYQYVNPADGMVYQRQFVNGAPILDDDHLKFEMPDLWIEITEIPNYEAIAELVYHAGVDHDGLKEWIDERWDGPRTLKPLDSLDAETLALVQAFVHPGKPSTKLPAPRKAKPEELAELADDDGV